MARVALSTLPCDRPGSARYSLNRVNYAVTATRSDVYKR